MFQSNLNGVSSQFDPETVSRQIKSLQIFETVHLLRSGKTILKNGCFLGKVSKVLGHTNAKDSWFVIPPMRRLHTQDAFDSICPEIFRPRWSTESNWCTGNRSKLSKVVKWKQERTPWQDFIYWTKTRVLKVGIRIDRSRSGLSAAYIEPKKVSQHHF
jgi:hypothetical protein